MSSWGVRSWRRTFVRGPFQHISCSDTNHCTQSEYKSELFKALGPEQSRQHVQIYFGQRKALIFFMKSSLKCVSWVSKGNVFRVAGPLWGESIGHRWIPLTKTSNAELWYFLWSAPEQLVEQTIETKVIWDAIALIMTSLYWTFGNKPLPEPMLTRVRDATCRYLDNSVDFYPICVALSQSLACK